MKKAARYLALLLIVLQLMSLSVPVYAAREDLKLVPDKYMLVLSENSLIGIADGEMSKLEAYPVKKNESLMLPAKYFFESLGYTFEAEDGKYTVKGDKSVVLSADSSEVSVDGTTHTLKEKTEVLKNQLFVSNDICNALGLRSTLRNRLFVVHEGEYNATKEKALLDLQGIYVAEGAKNGDGTAAKPYGNLEDAKTLAGKRVAKYGMDYPLYIFVKAGTYRFKDTVTFPAATFNKEDFKGVKIHGYDGEVRFSGATEIDEEKFQVVTDPMTLARLPKAGRGEVAYIDLSTQGISGLSTSHTSFPEVFVNDDRQIMSRWPNDGFTTVKAVIASGQFQFAEVNCKRWTLAKDLRVNGFFRNDYFYNTHKATNVDADAMIITASGLGSNRPGARWYARNLLEEVDSPGEWFVDRETNILYFYPPYTLKDAKVEVCTLMDKSLISAPNARNMEFNGITFEKSGSYAINAGAVRGLTVEKCKFLSLQQYAISASGYDITINGNYAFDLMAGIMHGTTGSLKTLESGNLMFTNNRAVACGWGFSNGNSICHGGYNTPELNASVGATIKNNVVQDCNTIYAFSYPGVDTKILNNEIINQSRNIHDGGSIYLGRSTSYIGNEIAYNYIHHLNRDSFFAGLYNDDGYAWSDWHHNVLYDMNRPVIIGLGMGMEFKYNLSINTVQGGTVGSRMNWSAGMYGQNGQMINSVKKILDYTEKYAEKEPRLVESITRTPYAAPWDAVIFGNVGVGSSSFSGVRDEFEKYGAKTIMRDGKPFDISATNSTREANPSYTYDAEVFVDPDTQNWNLNPESQIAKEYPELLEIDMEKIGLSEGGEHLRKLNETFKLRYPTNGQKSVQTKEIRFAWDQLPGASKYKLVVATDPKLENIVFEKELYENGVNNSYTTSDLALDTVYYWKVYGISIARQDQKVVESDGVPYAFKTAKKNELDKENAKLAIDSIKAFSDGITAEYVYEETFLENMAALIEKADKVYKEAFEQEELDALEEEIYNFIKRSPFFMTVSFSEPSFFDAKPEDWTTGGGTVTYEGDTIVISHPEGKAVSVSVPVEDTNTILCFQVKIDDLGENSGDYTGLYYKVDSQKGSSYLVCIKHDIYEFQKSGEGKFLIELPNHAVKSGEWFDIELGGIDMPNGVLEFARINGQLIFAELDQTPTQVRGNQKFSIRKNDEGNLSFRPAKTISDPGSLVDSIYESFNNPQNEKGLAAALKGAYQVLEMDNPLYPIIDKQPLADRIYPMIKSGEMQIKDRDISNYKAKLWENAILEAYTQGKGDVLFVNNVKHRYNDVTQFEKIDKPGIKLYEYFISKLKDIDRNNINSSTMKGTYKNLDELRMEFARQIFAECINVCGGTFAADSTYMFDILTKETADYLGINIDGYLKLSDKSKTTVHEYIGRSGASTSRTVEEIVAEINETVAGLK